jgi:hypothetical protein
VRHDLPGPAFRLLSPEVAYLKLSSAKSKDAARYVTEAARSKGWIIDARFWSVDKTPVDKSFELALGPLLVDRESPYARLTKGDLSNPGAFYWTKPVELTPGRLHYKGKIVILVDEFTVGDTEYAVMALRTAPGAIVVGSTTGGASRPGGTFYLALPGGSGAWFRDTSAFYPDKRPTQRIGIKIDVRVKPTIAGIRAGRDEVLEVGLRQIVGADKAAALIKTLSKEMGTTASPESKL